MLRTCTIEGGGFASRAHAKTWAMFGPTVADAGTPSGGGRRLATWTSSKRRTRFPLGIVSGVDDKVVGPDRRFTRGQGASRFSVTVKLHDGLEETRMLTNHLVVELER